MSPTTRTRLIVLKETLESWYVSLALFCIQFGSALLVAFSSWRWFSVPLFALAAADGFQFIRRFSMSKSTLR